MRPVFAISQALIGTLSAASAEPSSDEILARLESENNRRHVLLKEYSGSRQYTRYTVLTRSGSDKLNGIIDKVLASEQAPAHRRRISATKSLPPTTGFASSGPKSQRDKLAMS
jgi:hypothetical protein